MPRTLRQLALMLAPPGLACALVAGVFVENSGHQQPGDAAPYHARARAAVDRVPYMIGTWTGTNAELPTAAQKLLKPNAAVNRVYIDSQPTASADDGGGGGGGGGGGDGGGRRASLLIVQCSDSRDMIGHFPPNCYPASGMEPDPEAPHGVERDWHVGDLTLAGREYRFSYRDRGQKCWKTVYNFLIVPGRGVVRDMTTVAAAAADYQLRYYGAAQFQVVFDDPAGQEPTRADRDRVFATLLGPDTMLIRTLASKTPIDPAAGPTPPAPADRTPVAQSPGALQ